MRQRMPNRVDDCEDYGTFLGIDTREGAGSHRYSARHLAVSVLYPNASLGDPIQPAGLLRFPGNACIPVLKSIWGSREIESAHEHPSVTFGSLLRPPLCQSLLLRMIELRRLRKARLPSSMKANRTLRDTLIRTVGREEGVEIPP